MKHLLVYSSDFAPNDGGIARLCTALAVGCTGVGVDVQVISPVAGRGVPPSLQQIREVRLNRARPWREVDSYRAMRDRTDKGPVVCGLWYPDGLLAQIARARPRVILAHGIELMPTKARWRREIWQRMLRSVCESADLVVANSEYSRQLVLESAPRANAVAIPLAVDHVRFSPGDVEQAKRRFGVTNKIVLSTVSRLHAYKGHDLVLRALAASGDRARRNFVYLIVGKGPHRAELERLVGELALTEQVQFLGFVAEDDLADLYRASDLFLLCSRKVIERQEVEGFGLVFLEAQSCGVPVVGARSGGILDAVKEGRGGWLIAEDDRTALVRILKWLVSDPGSFRAAGREARMRIESECTWEHYVRRFTSTLEANGIWNG